MKLIAQLARYGFAAVLAAACSLTALANTPETIQVPEKRIALVIGNASYAEAPLVNPINDARLLKSTLTALGFEVIEHTDLDAESMKTAIRDFGARLRDTPGSVGLFYFAGHGVQFKGVNYLLPVGRSFASEAEIEDSAINADAILRRIQEGGSKVGFVVLDACRNNPFGKVASRSLRTMVGGLARMDAPSGTLIAYSTAMGAVASDGTGGNGLYTRHLVRNMKVPGITAEQMFKRTREGVELESANAQSPREESSLKGADFHFLPLSEGRKVNPELVELTYWESIRASQDSGDFQAYLRDYPKGKFASLAKQNLDKLQKAAKADPALGQLGVAYASVSRGETARAEGVFKQLGASAKKDDRARGKEGLAEIALTQGALDRAAALADEVLSVRPKSSAALLIKAKIAHKKGNRDEAERLLMAATADGVSDFPWQKVNALLAAGNLQRKDKPAAASAAYEAALKIDAGNLEALSNLATVLRESGNPQKALDVIKQAKAASPSGGDRVIEALAYQIQQDISERRDMDRQKMVDESVRELVARFKEQKSLPAPVSQDQWTTPPIAISVLGFQELERPLSGRVGIDVLLGQELARELKVHNVLVVDRALIDKVLAELKLGASSLADPDTQLKLGRLTAARLIAVGRIFQLNGKDHVSFRLIDTETSQIVVNRTEEAGASIDPIAMSARLARIAVAEVQAKYPVKGRLVALENDGVIVNLGKKNGLITGDLFKVLGEGKPIEFNGKVIGMREVPLGTLRIAAVEDQMAMAVPVDRNGVGSWAANLRIVQTRAGAP